MQQNTYWSDFIYLHNVEHAHLIKLFFCVNFMVFVMVTCIL